MEEYKMLRAEILELYAEINNCSSILYAAVATILVFALQSDNYLMCLIPYLVIVPLFFLCEYKHSHICFIAAYLYTFLEKDVFQWEHRHHFFEVYFAGKRNWQTHFIYHVSAGACASLAVYKIFSSDFSHIGKYIRVSVVLVLFLAIAIIMMRSVTKYIVAREKMINQWKEVKEVLERPTRTNRS